MAPLQAFTPLVYHATRCGGPAVAVEACGRRMCSDGIN